MKDFEVSVEPVQDWLSKTEKMVHESSNRLYDLPAKRREQQKLQVTTLGRSAMSASLSCVHAPGPVYMIPILCACSRSCVHAPCPVCMLSVLCASLCPSAREPLELHGAEISCPPSLFLTDGMFPSCPCRWICLCLAASPVSSQEIATPPRHTSCSPACVDVRALGARAPSACDVLPHSLLIVTCLCFSVCP